MKPVGRLLCSNGPTWNKQGTKFYHADSPANIVSEFDYDKKTGELSNRKTFMKMTKQISTAGIFDGSTMDADGNLWWAIANGSKIIKINPNTKKVLETIDFPMYQLPCSAMFGGPNYKHMLVTTIGQDVCGTQKMLGG